MPANSRIQDLLECAKDKCKDTLMAPRKKKSSVPGASTISCSNWVLDTSKVYVTHGGETINVTEYVGNYNFEIPFVISKLYH